MNLKLTTTAQENVTIIHLNCVGSEKGSEQMFICNVTRQGEDYRAIIPESELKDLFNAVSSARISAVGDCPIGGDGVTYELIIENGYASATYRWWMVPHEKWHPLSLITDKLLQLAFQVSGQY
jgi:hypothetical protein